MNKIFQLYYLSFLFAVFSQPVNIVEIRLE